MVDGQLAHLSDLVVQFFLVLDDPGVLSHESDVEGGLLVVLHCFQQGQGELFLSPLQNLLHDT